MSQTSRIRVSAWIVLFLMGTSLAAAQSTEPPGDLKALPQATDQIRLTWSDITSDETGFAIQRMERSDAWQSDSWQSLVTALPAGTQEYIDTVPPVAAGASPVKYVYRVASEHGAALSPWSASSAAVPVYDGKPFYNWIVIEPGSTAAQIQAEINKLSIDVTRTAPEELEHNVNRNRGRHALFFRNGTYDIDTTLYVEGRRGIQFVGESPGGVTLRWTGSRGTGPDDTRALFHAEGTTDSTFRNIVWDGGCDEPAQGHPDDGCFVVAFDQSYCGRCTGPWVSQVDGERVCESGDRRDWTCDALTWEKNAIGFADARGAHYDSVFQNAYIGLRIGHYRVMDAEITIRRCQFVDNFAGATVEDFNALSIWFWDSLFDGNYVGATNDIADVRKKYDPTYTWHCMMNPGTTCQNDTVCKELDLDDFCSRRWAGDFQVRGSQFINSDAYDMWAQPTGYFVIRDNESTGSAEFFRAAGKTTGAGNYSLIRNHIEDASGHTIYTRSPGPFLLVDNEVVSGSNDPPVYSDMFNYTGLPNPDREAISIIASGNEFSDGDTDGSPPEYDCFATCINLPGQACDADADCVPVGGCPVGETCECGFTTDPFCFATYIDPEYRLLLQDPGNPALPEPVSRIATDPLEGVSVYTVADPALVQEVIGVALANPPSIVHFPSLNDPGTCANEPGTLCVVNDDCLPSGGSCIFQVDSYGITQTLFIPAESDLTLVGDGTSTELEWLGQGNDPILQIDAANAGSGRVMVRDLTFRGSGVVAHNLNQSGGDVFANRVTAAKPGEVGILVNGTDPTRVDFLDIDFGGDFEEDQVATNVGVQVKAGYEAVANNQGVWIWSGSAGRNATDVKVSNNVAGAKVLVSNVYSEDSTRYLHVHGGGGAGQVTVHNAKIAPIVPGTCSGDPNEPCGADSDCSSGVCNAPYLPLAAGIVWIDGFPGNVSVVEADMHIQRQFEGIPPLSHPSAEDYGARIRVTGLDPSGVQSIGISVREASGPETDFPTGFDEYLRIGSKILTTGTDEGTRPLPDLVPAGTTWSDGADLGLDLIRNGVLPSFYDETTDASVVFDKVAFRQAQTTGLALIGGQACNSSSECDDGLCYTDDSCDFAGLAAGVPGQCRYDPVPCLSGSSCSSYGDCHTVFGSCSSADTDCDRCWSTDNGGEWDICEWAGQTIYHSTCDCEANYPGAFCASTSRSSYCYQDCPPDCDDGLFCNGEEYCEYGVGCLSGPPPCSASQFCDEQAQTCTDRCPASHGCEGTDCRLVIPKECTSYDTGTNLCWQPDEYGDPEFFSCKGSKTFHVTNCECEAIGNGFCVSHNQSWTCKN